MLGRSSRFKKEVVVEYKGSKFLFGRGYEEVGYSLYLDESEPLTYKYLTNQSGNLFIDLGANVGGYTIRLGRKFRSVISVEPNPNAVEILRKHLELNHLQNVKVVEKAIWDSIGEATLGVPAGNKTTLSTIGVHFEGGTSITVHTTTLDSLTEGYERVDVIKMDVEGVELSALKGAGKTLQKTSRLVIEVGPWSEDEVKGILAPLGFKFSDLDTGGKQGTKNILAESVL